VADEVGHKAAGGLLEQGAGIGPLVQVAAFHHANLVANRKGLQLVVRDEQRGRLRGLEDVAQLMGQAFTQIHIEVGEGLIQQHQLRPGRQRPGQRHPLLLAA